MSQVINFLPVFELNFCTHCPFSVTCPVHITLLDPFQQYVVRRSNHGSPYYAVLSIPVLPVPLRFAISIVPSERETNFHTHMK
jgi:hypothetical protein